MSRIGKKLIKKDKNVQVSFDNSIVNVQGVKGSLSLSLCEGISLAISEEIIEVVNLNQDKSLDAKHGLYRALIVNMIQGVSFGFHEDLEIIGVGYKVLLQGKSLVFSLGFSHPVVVEPPLGISFVVEGQNKIKVLGIDKEVVGQVASNIRSLKAPDAYKGKGIKYMGEFIKKKQGKSVKK